MSDRPRLLSADAWASNAEYARDHVRMHNYCAEVEADRPTDPRDPWRPELQRRMAQAEMDKADAFAWYARLAATAATNARLEEMSA